MTSLTIATRRSPLALWQAEFVAELLRKSHPECTVELLPMSTRGDELLDRSLAAIGGKGLFLKELEQALLDGRADIAVHSMKDVPTELPDGLTLTALLARHNPRDALVSNQFDGLESLPQGAVVGTASLRRQSQLLARRPDLQIETLRGNVNTRLAKLDDGQFDAIVLACAGLERLEMGQRVTEAIDPERMVPAVTQGIIGVECRDGDEHTATLLAPLHDPTSAVAAAAERAFAARLGGNCQVPVGGYAEVQHNQLVMTGLIAAPDGGRVVRGAIAGAATEADSLGDALAARLLSQGADDILAALDG